VVPAKNWPNFLKTVSADPLVEASADKQRWSVDKNCSTLKTSTFRKTLTGIPGDPKETLPALPNSFNDNYFSNYRRYSAAKLWSDFRGVKAVNDGSAQAPATYYSGAGGSPQTTKRVVIRAIWSHNQGTQR
jgi:hypothetical protein